LLVFALHLQSAANLSLILVQAAAKERERKLKILRAAVAMPVSSETLRKVSGDEDDSKDEVSNDFCACALFSHRV